MTYNDIALCAQNVITNQRLKCSHNWEGLTKFPEGSVNVLIASIFNTTAYETKQYPRMCILSHFFQHYASLTIFFKLLNNNQQEEVEAMMAKMDVWIRLGKSIHVFIACTIMIIESEL